MSARFAVLCPGRGSYTERSMGRLDATDPLVARVEVLRAELGLGSLLELDRAERFSAARHLAPSNAAALIWLRTMLDLRPRVAGLGDAEGATPVAVAGNSMGWYTALAVAGVLDLDDGFRLVQRMALLQEERRGGGQLLYPLVGEDWRPAPERRAAVEAALAGAPGEAFASIHLGGYAVLAGSDAGLAALMAVLPPVEVGRNRYPMKLVGHGPYHTPLAAPVAERAREALADLRWHPPRATLVDGRGVRHTPWSADLAALEAYTLGHQVTRPYDLTRSLAVLLREHAPDELLLPGPGNSLGGVVGQVLVAEGWRGLRDRAGFEALQASDAPLVTSLDR